MIRIERVGAVFTAILLLSSILSTSADARSSRLRQVPNGISLGCVACHVSSGGGGPRNAFGLQIEADFLSQAGFSGVVLWGPELAALDADGDGATNGEELGDPDGTWQQGDANPEGEIFFPWDAESTPPPPPPSAPTAIETTGWGQIKLLLDSE